MKKEKVYDGSNIFEKYKGDFLVPINKSSWVKKEAKKQKEVGAGDGYDTEERAWAGMILFC